MKVKIHMALYVDEDSFRTLCGISERCSESFYENLGQRLAEFGNDKKTTCKKCLKQFDIICKNTNH